MHERQRASVRAPRNAATSARAATSAAGQLAAEEPHRVGLHPVAPGLLLLEHGRRHRAVRAVVEVRHRRLERPERPDLAASRRPTAGWRRRPTRCEGSAGMMATLWSSTRATHAQRPGAAGRRGRGRRAACPWSPRRRWSSRSRPRARPRPSRRTTRAGSRTWATPARWWSSPARSTGRAAAPCCGPGRARRRRTRGSWSASRCAARVGRNGFVLGRPSGGRTRAPARPGTFAVVVGLRQRPRPGHGAALPGGRPERLVDLRPSGPTHLQRAAAAAGGRRRVAHEPGPRTCPATAGSTGTRGARLQPAGRRAPGARRPAGGRPSPADTRLGGGIFLHVSGPGATAGCVSVRPRRRCAGSCAGWTRPPHPVLVMGPRSALSRL